MANYTLDIEKTLSWRFLIHEFVYQQTRLKFISNYYTKKQIEAVKSNSSASSDIHDKLAAIEKSCWEMQRLIDAFAHYELIDETPVEVDETLVFLKIFILEIDMLQKRMESAYLDFADVYRVCEPRFKYEPHSW